ncbi:hypothetical protein AURDEDRAFT_177056 [Auricularia subglabra TFB-10046 SS5]|uniref:Uncharacterized protein n=1 Tax=Auricularia subglabra (strain TFB-10046 / SS5) TaxID=717982 RepID=J0WNC4_AURST|nr:hypothetical protein AURDEDRAFT_177056 [Auricularia subglabra TFB-10046 SS5]
MTKGTIYSTETVKQSQAPAPLPPKPKAPAPTAQEICDRLLAFYRETEFQIDLGEIESNGATESLYETPKQAIHRIARLEFLNGYVLKTGTQFQFHPGIVSQFERALGFLVDLIGKVHSLFQIHSEDRLLADDWADPLFLLVNELFANPGIAKHLFYGMQDWLQYGNLYICYLLSLVSLDRVPASRPPVDFSLKGHYNDFIETTVKGRQNRSIMTPFKTPASATRPGTASAQPWKAKDSVAVTKMLSEADASFFAFKKNNRRVSHALMGESAHIDGLSFLSSPLPPTREDNEPTSGRHLADVLDDE